MSLKHREDSIAAIRRREALQTKVATSATLADGAIVLEIPEGGVCTGTTVKFTSPCNCEDVTGGLRINGSAFAVVDATKEVVTGTGGMWAKNAEISVLLDCESSLAYLQNTVAARTRSDLNSHIADKNNPHEVHATQVPTSDECASLIDILANPNVDEALKMLWRLFNMLDLRFKGTNGEFTWNMYRQGATVRGTASINGGNAYHDYESGIRRTTIWFNMADTVTVVDDVIVLNNPTLYTIETDDGGSFITSVSDIRGKYISYQDVIYQVLSGTTNVCNGGTHGDGTSEMANYDYANITINNLGIVVVGTTYVGNVSSKDENAYPDKEWVGDTYYVKNNVELGLPVIAEGSYTGMGVYGVSSANGLVLPFVPEMVVIQSTTTDKSVTLLHGCTGTGGLVVTWDDDEKSVTWYHASSAANQLNSAIEYRYFAIGKGVWS